MKWASLTNMGLAMKTMDRLTNRPEALSGIGVFFGRSGIGKTVSAAFVSAQTNAAFIRCTSTATPKWLLEKLLRELGGRPAGRITGTIAAMTDMVTERLMQTGRPVIVDEADHIVKRQFIEVLRDIHDGSDAPLLLIGEEFLPEKLEAWERFHNRVLTFQAASLPTPDDVLLLRDFHARDGVRVADDLALRFADECRGAIRRIAMNLNEAAELALEKGWAEIDCAQWGARPVNTGKIERCAAPGGGAA